MSVSNEFAGPSIAYLYDDTFEGLLSAVFAAYACREDPEDMVPERLYQPRFGQEARFIATDFNRAERVRRGVLRTAGSRAFRAVQRAALNEDPEAGTVVYRFIRYIMSRDDAGRSNPVMEDLSNPVVAAVVEREKRAMNEAEKMRQFVRFTHLENGVWYAKCAPNVSVLPLVMGYFADRFNVQPFIIYDERHHLAGVHDGGRWSLVRGDAVNLPSETADEALVQEAWKRFYDTLSIDARYNPELRSHFMPQRLRANITEMQPRKA